MLKRVYLFSLVLLGSLMTAWADASTVTVKDQPTVNGETVKYADGSKTVAYTSANNAIWYLGDVDIAKLKSIEVKGLALVSGTIGDVETMAELKIAYMPIGSETTVDADYMTTNSSTIRGASRLLAKIVANTVPTTIADGKNATNYAGANFLIKSTVTQTGTYDGTVTMGECTGISKTSESVHLFVYGTADKRRMAVDQIVINTKMENPVYNKTLDKHYTDLNAAFGELTDADTEIEISDDVTLTGRLTWNKAHTLTITPKANITINGHRNAMWFLANVNNAVMNIGCSDYTITLEGPGQAMEYDVAKYENNATIALTNVAFKNFNLNSKGHLIGSNANEGQIILDKVTFSNCKNPANAFINKLRVTDDRLVLKGYLNIDSDCEGTAIYAASETKTDGIKGRIKINDDNFTASNIITINWAGDKAEGAVVVIGTKAANASKFTLTDGDWALTRKSNGDLYMTTPKVKIGSKGYADIAMALSAAADEDVITLLADQEISSRVNVQNKAITIDGDSKYTIKRATGYTNGLLFLTVKPGTSEKNATLTLKDVTIDGQSLETSAAVVEASNNGTTILDNVTIQNITTTADAVIVNKNGGKLTLKGNITVPSIFVGKGLTINANDAIVSATTTLVVEDGYAYGLIVVGGSADKFTCSTFRLSQQQDGVYVMPLSVAGSYTHPTLLHTASDITAVKDRLTTDALAAAAYTHLKDAGVGASYTASPVEYLKRMDANNWSGTYSDYNNFSQAANDAKAAYQLALRYQLGGETNCATAAVNILNSWATTNKGFLRLTGYNNNIPDPNEYLMTIQAYQFANAAELLRDYNGWQAADFQKFQNWIRQTFADVAILFLENHHKGSNALHYWLNWDLAALNAMLSVGIFCDDKALVDYALNYVGNGAGNGNKANATVATHNDPDSEETLAQCQESGRDQGHATLNVSLLGVLCQTAQNIGTDLFTPYKALEMAEYVGKYNLKDASDKFIYTSADVPFTTYDNGDVSHTAISADARGTVRPCWELFYAYAKKNNKDAAYTTAWVNYMRTKNAWGEGEGTSTDELGFGTLMFGIVDQMTLNITEAGAATLVLPFGAALPAGVKAYTLNYTAGNDKVKATEVTAITANQPVLINAAAGNYTFTSNGTTNTDSPVYGALTGVYATKVVPTGSYILTLKDGVTAFRKADGSTNTVAANHAYLTADGAGASILDIDFGNTTGISTTLVNSEKRIVNSVYDLQGRKVAQPTKGLYIVNGKKVIIK